MAYPLDKFASTINREHFLQFVGIKLKISNFDAQFFEKLIKHIKNIAFREKSLDVKVLCF